MAKKKHATVDDAIADSEYVLEKYKFVKLHYPDVTLNGYYQGYVSKDPFFLSKSVNDTYTHFYFKEEYPREYKKQKALIGYSYKELVFDYNGKTEVLQIYSSPRANTVAYIERPEINFGKGISSGVKTVPKKSIIKFSEFIKNLHNDKFDEKMLKKAQALAIDFIKNNQNCELDQTNLDDRLKKLLWFT